MAIATTTTSPWPSRFAFGAALIFTLASGGTNLIHGWGRGADLPSSLVWAAVSVGVSIVFALSWPAFILSLDRRQWTRAVLVFVALLVTGTYSVAAALGSAMGGRQNAAITETATTDTRTKAQHAYDAATAELASLKPSRPVAEVEALMSAARPERHVHIVGGQRRTVWGPPPSLASELGRARRRVELETKIERITGELSSTRPAKVANSDAVALATYLQGLGLGIDADRMNKLLVLLAVLVIECGGGLALAVGMALGEAGVRSGQTEGAIGQGERALAECPTEHLDAGPERTPQIASTNGVVPRLPALNERPVRSAHERVLSALRAKDGVLFGSQGALGASFGWSKTRMNEVLHQLQAAGRVHLSTSRQGTAVRLIAFAA